MLLENERFNRQISIFGVQGQKKIQSTKVVLVGFGGLGTFVFPQLCLLGVKHITVVEHETFSATNRNRYMGFLSSDFDDEKGIGIDKVLVAKRIAKGIDSKIDIKLIKNRLGVIVKSGVHRLDQATLCLTTDTSSPSLNLIPWTTLAR